MTRSILAPNRRQGRYFHWCNKSTRLVGRRFTTAGRFDHEISMNVPDEEGRAQILRVRLSDDFDFRALARQTLGYVGGDLVVLTGWYHRCEAHLSKVADEKIQLPPTPPLPADGLMLDESIGAVTSNPDVAIEVEAVLVDENASTSLAVPALETLLDSSIAEFLEAHPSPLTPQQLEPLHITYADFLTALPAI